MTWLLYFAVLVAAWWLLAVLLDRFDLYPEHWAASVLAALATLLHFGGGR